MPTTDLDTLRDRVEALLTDSANADWSTAELDNAIRLALAELSTMLPARGVTTIDAAEEIWEYDLSAITGLLGIVEVWYPYLSTDSDYKKPSPVEWRMLDDTTLLLDEDIDVETGYEIRVFYDKLQTVQGLDSATATTLTEPEKAVLIVGAAGYAALAKARDLQNSVTLGVNVPKQLEMWGRARLVEFNQRVYALSSQESAGEDARIGWWKADKWDE